MILYRFAKWLEESNRIKRTIRESREMDSDITLLVHRKEQVDEQIRMEASRILAADYTEEPFPAPYMMEELEQTQEFVN